MQPAGRQAGWQKNQSKSLKQIFLYGGIMLLLASGMFYMYYNAGRFNNTYQELDERMEAINEKAGESKDTLKAASSTGDSLYEK